MREQRERMSLVHLASRHPAAWWVLRKAWGRYVQKGTASLDAWAIECPRCGSGHWKLACTFDEETHEMSTYSLDMYCIGCGIYAQTPLPSDVD